MIQSPFNPLPLNVNPYFSRITDNYDTSKGIPKNYFLVGFKPGFPLQASELNEMQEQFYVQQTLTNMCFSQWAALPGAVPFTVQATPLSPSYINLIGSGSTPTRTLIISSGWYYLHQPGNLATGGIGLWIWNPYQYSETLDFTNLNNTSKFLYCNNYSIVDVSLDSNLSDNSGGGSAIKTFGADRIKINISGYENVSGTIPFNILSITKTQTGTGNSKFTYSIISCGKPLWIFTAAS